MPLIIAKLTIVHAANKQPDMMAFNSPDSSMELVMLRAFRNQKYDVAELRAHSFTVDEEQTTNTHILLLYITHGDKPVTDIITPYHLILTLQVTTESRYPTLKSSLNPQTFI